MDRRLLPREHGAYAQLGFPLLGGLLLGTPGASAVLFAAAAVLLFLANEPLAVLLGVRGTRARDEWGAPARMQLALRAGLGCAAGAAALWVADPQTRWLALVPAAFAGALLPIVLRRSLKTLPGEIVAAAAFSTMHLPVAAAGGASGELLWGPPALWFAATVVATLCVHAIKSRVTGATPWVVAAASRMAWIALGAALAGFFVLPEGRPIALAACVPLAAVVAINLLGVSTKRLKPVGWTLSAANAAALALLVAMR